MFSTEFENYAGSVQKEIEALAFEKKTNARLMKARISIAPPETPLLPLPPEINVIPTDRLGVYLMNYESQVGWIETCKARREVDLETAKELVGYLRNKKLEFTEGKVTEKKQIVEKELIRFKMELLEIESDVKALGALKNDVERKAKALSREISIRQTVYNAEGRTNFVKG